MVILTKAAKKKLLLQIKVKRLTANEKMYWVLTLLL